MLSQNLNILSVWWDDVLSGRAQFTRAEAVEFSRSLAEAAEAAELMEALLRSSQLFTCHPQPPYGGNVVPFCRPAPRELARVPFDDGWGRGA